MVGIRNIHPVPLPSHILQMSDIELRPYEQIFLLGVSITEHFHQSGVWLFEPRCTTERYYHIP